MIVTVTLIPALDHTLEPEQSRSAVAPGRRHQ